MENIDNIEELIAGYALDMLDDTEQAQVEQLLATDPAARALLAELNELTSGLALSVAPVELPSGSLERLRQKAGVAAPTRASTPTSPAPPTTLTHITGPAPLKFKPRTRTNLAAGFSLSWAAAIVLFITTAIFAGLWANSLQSPSLSDNDRNIREVAQLLSSPTLKVSELKPTGNSSNGTLRLYADTTTNKAYLVTQNLTGLPSDKEYEAWLITGDNQTHKAGLLGTGANGTTVYALATSQSVDQYKAVAITVENKGGVDKTTQQPILLGAI